ncbi:hypothetical protein TWF281_003792 [Arthrobotrys megalospora]
MCWTIYRCLCTHPHPKFSVSTPCNCDLFRVSAIRKPCPPCEALANTEDTEYDRSVWERDVGRNEFIVSWLASGGKGNRWLEESNFDERA